MIISFISSKKSFSNQQEVIHRYVADSHALITKALNTNNKTFCQNQNGKSHSFGIITAGVFISTVEILHQHSGKNL